MSTLNAANAAKKRNARGSIRGQAWVQLAFKSQQMEAAMSATNLLMFALSLVGLAFAIAANETCFDASTLRYTAVCPTGDYFKLASVASLIAMDLALVYYYYVRARAKMVRWFYASVLQSFLRSTLWLQFLCEFALFQIQTYPYVDDPTGGGAAAAFHHQLVVVMFLRLYLGATAG
jgi:hypothetical protein